MAEAHVHTPSGFGDNADEAEQQLAFVESLTRSYQRRVRMALENVRNSRHPYVDGCMVSQLHEHAKMIRREVLALDKMIQTW